MPGEREEKVWLREKAYRHHHHRDRDDDCAVGAATATTTAAGYAVSTAAAAAANAANAALDDDDDQIKLSIHTNNYTPKINNNQTLERANDLNWPNDAGETIEMHELTRTKRNNLNERETNGHHINQSNLQM